MERNAQVALGGSGLKNRLGSDLMPLWHMGI